MAREVRKFKVVVPAGTPILNPYRQALEFPPRVVRELQIRIPPGPRGTVGFQVGQAGWQVFPTEPGEWFVSDDERIVWPIEDANTSGAWQVIAYNLGAFDHALEFRFLVDLTGPSAVAAAPATLPTLPSLAQLPSLAPAPLPGGIDLGQLTPNLPTLPALPAPPVLPGLPLPAPGSLPSFQFPALPSVPLPPSLTAPVPLPAPGLAPGPAIPTAPGRAAPQAVDGTYPDIEARTQAIQEAQAAASNPDVWTSIEDRTHAIQEAQAASTARPATTRPGIQLYI